MKAIISNFVILCIVLFFFSCEKKNNDNFLLLFSNNYREKDSINIEVKINNSLFYKGKIGKMQHSDQYFGLSSHLKAGENSVSINILDIEFEKDYTIVLEEQGTLFAFFNFETAQVKGLLPEGTILTPPSIKFNYINDKPINYYTSLDIKYLTN